MYYESTKVTKDFGAFIVITYNTGWKTSEIYGKLKKVPDFDDGRDERDM